MSSTGSAACQATKCICLAVLRLYRHALWTRACRLLPAACLSCSCIANTTLLRYPAAAYALTGGKRAYGLFLAPCAAGGQLLQQWESWKGDQTAPASAAPPAPVLLRVLMLCQLLLLPRYCSLLLKDHDSCRVLLTTSFVCLLMAFHTLP